MPSRSRRARLVFLALVLAWGFVRVVQHVTAPAPGPARVAIVARSAAGSTMPPPPSLAHGHVDPRILLARRCLELAETDPLAAMEFAIAQDLARADRGLLDSLILHWAAHDFDTAYAWAKSQEAGAWRNDVIARLAHLRAKSDPLGAARMVVTDISAGRARDEATISVLHQWALKDKDAAGLWAESLADERLRQRASAEVAGLMAAPVRVLH